MGKLSDTTRITAQSLRNPVFWMVNFGVLAICFLSGPFGTMEGLPGGIRLIYWGLIVLTTSVLALWFHALLRVAEWTSVSALSAVSLLFGLLVVGLVLALSLALLQPMERYPGHLNLVSYSFPSAAVIFLLSVFVARSVPQADVRQPEKRPALFGRLEKFPHARTVLSLSAQDHYVEVTTDLGAELCLMRLNDAIALVDPIDGFQIHRSHWVARSAVDRVDSKGSTARVMLTDGRALGISKSRLAGFRAFLQNG